MFLAGQGLYGRIVFTDGTTPEYDRPYLIAEVLEDKIGVLNISTVAGKESKLLFPTNKLINKHSPPFTKRSFVKLDSFVYVSTEDAQNMKILDGGNTIDKAELSCILKAVKEYL